MSDSYPICCSCGVRTLYVVDPPSTVACPHCGREHLVTGKPPSDVDPIMSLVFMLILTSPVWIWLLYGALK